MRINGVRASVIDAETDEKWNRPAEFSYPPAVSGSRQRPRSIVLKGNDSTVTALSINVCFLRQNSQYIQTTQQDPIIRAASAEPPANPTKSASTKKKTLVSDSPLAHLSSAVDNASDGGYRTPPQTPISPTKAINVG